MAAVTLMVWMHRRQEHHQRELRARWGSIHLRQLVASVHYHDGRVLPPAVIRDREGESLASGFVLLRRYLDGPEELNRWNLREPWDSPANRRLATLELSGLSPYSMRAGRPHRTDFDFVVGPGTIWEDDAKPATLDEIKAADGLSRTILFIELKNSQQPWAAPGGWNPWTHQGAIEGNTPGKLLVGMADGSVVALDTSDPNLLQLLRELADFRDGKPVHWPP
jgi:hypothetical protein